MQLILCVFCASGAAVDGSLLTRLLCLLVSINWFVATLFCDVKVRINILTDHPGKPRSLFVAEGIIGAFYFAQHKGFMIPQNKVWHAA